MENNLIETANNTFKALDNEQKKVAKMIFQGITHRQVNYTDEPRPTTLGELAIIAGASVETCREVVQKFSKQQILSNNQVLKEGSLVQLAPDATLQGWELLERWQQEEFENAQTYQQWVTHAQAYEKEKELLSGCDLKQAIVKRETMQPSKAWASRYDPDYERAMSFIDFSKTAEDEERRMKDSLVRRNKIIFQVIFAFICLIMIGSLIASYISYESEIATRARTTQIINGQKQQIDSLQKVIQKLQKNE